MPIRRFVRRHLLTVAAATFATGLLLAGFGVWATFLRPTSETITTATIATDHNFLGECLQKTLERDLVPGDSTNEARRRQHALSQVTNPDRQDMRIVYDAHGELRFVVVLNPVGDRKSRATIIHYTPKSLVGTIRQALDGCERRPVG